MLQVVKFLRRKRLKYEFSGSNFIDLLMQSWSLIIFWIFFLICICEDWNLSNPDSPFQGLDRIFLIIMFLVNGDYFIA